MLHYLIYVNKFHSCFFPINNFSLEFYTVYFSLLFIYFDVQFVVCNQISPSPKKTQPFYQQFGFLKSPFFNPHSLPIYIEDLALAYADVLSESSSISPSPCRCYDIREFSYFELCASKSHNHRNLVFDFYYSDLQNVFLNTSFWPIIYDHYIYIKYSMSKLSCFYSIALLFF